MMDFVQIIRKETREGTHLYPDWIVGKTTDLMTRTGTFYAIWNEVAGQWSTDIYEVQRLVDDLVLSEQKRFEAETGVGCTVGLMRVHSTRLWDGFQRYLKNCADNAVDLDQHLTFADQVCKKEDYSSKRVSYTPTDGDYSSWDELLSTLYIPAERAKIEWAIGAILTGDSTFIQKFLVFYGPPGSGKSTILNVISRLFEGYVSTFDARELSGANNQFATAAFKSNPLVAIQHDGDLSRIVDNTKLNSIVAHETMLVNEKYRAAREAQSRAFIFLGTNVPVKITDAKSGILRRLIDVVPTGTTIDPKRYSQIMSQIEFELGAIAQRCIDVYSKMGPNFYSDYMPQQMMMKTDVFYNFVEDHLDVFSNPDGVTLKQAYSLYKEYCEQTGIDRLLPQYQFREELKNYFESFEARASVDGVQVRSLYSRFRRLDNSRPVAEVPLASNDWIESIVHREASLLDELYSDRPAQYAKADGSPEVQWASCSTVLSDIDTTRTHYVRVPDNHIVIDFDLVDDKGNKSLERCLEAIESWPPTYAEVSRSGCGIHLHYVYSGDTSELSNLYAPGIEIKTFPGKAALRRRLGMCNTTTMTTIGSGLPKKEQRMLSETTLHSERQLRDLIERNLRKEVHPGTKPSIDFIAHILDEAYEQGLAFDLTDMRPKIITFAGRSTNQAELCLKIALNMHFVGPTDYVEEVRSDKPIVFFDVEVYPNLFVVCWKLQGSDSVVKMINPSATAIEDLLRHRLIGFNNRRYDNHILYAAMLGYSPKELYRLSSKIVSGDSGPSPYFAPAYALSYADVYDFSSVKKGLKKFQIDLGIFHDEMDIPWDEDVPIEKWDRVAEYCANDVISTEKVFESRSGDWKARLILADLSGLSPNHTTQAHTAKIIFGDTKRPSDSFVYTDLSKEFPGYSFDFGKSSYRGEEPGEGGYVSASPGYYEDVTVLDVTSMHPTSIVQLNLFGPYTDRFKELVDARVAIKQHNLELAKSYLGGKLEPYLDGDTLESLSYALKIIINIVYGLTSANFDNPFRDNRNKDNIVAKRGSLFMIDLKQALLDKGVEVVHIKTDSVKIVGCTPEIQEFVSDFGAQYGYSFEVEALYDHFCLVNSAVYVAKTGDKWSTVGAQFSHPYVMKRCFTGEPVEFDDVCESRSVKQGAMYLETSDGLRHVGRTGSFVASERGGILWRINNETRHSVSGTKGFRWLSRDVARLYSDDGVDVIDYTYYDALVGKARSALLEFGMPEHILQAL